jgi:hypothetical protein
MQNTFSNKFKYDIECIYEKNYIDGISQKQVTMTHVQHIVKSSAKDKKLW